MESMTTVTTVAANPEITFEAEFVKLLNVLKQISEEVPGLHRRVTLYEEAYNKTISAKHLRYFEGIYQRAADDIATEMEYGSWLAEGDYNVVFGKGKSGAELALTKIYNKAVAKAAQQPYPLPGKELVPIHPKIMLLHLYRIFTLVAMPDQLINLKRRVAVLEQDLRGENQAAPAQGLQASIGPLLQMARETFGKNATPEQNKVMDTVINMASSQQLGETINQFGSSMNDLMSLGTKLMPQLMASANDVRTGKSDFQTVVGNLLTQPEVSEQLSKLDGLRPIISQAANMLEQQGIEMPQSILGDISQVPVSDLVRDVLASPEAQKEISQLNQSATSLIRDPSRVEQLTQVGRSLAQSNGFDLSALAGLANQMGLDGGAGSGASGNEHSQVAGLSQLAGLTPVIQTGPMPDLNSLQNTLASLPPDQLAALMAQFSQQRL